MYTATCTSPTGQPQMFWRIISQTPMTPSTVPMISQTLMSGNAMATLTDTDYWDGAICGGAGATGPM